MRVHDQLVDTVTTFLGDDAVKVSDKVNFFNNREVKITGYSGVH